MAKAKQATEESEWRDRIVEFRKMRVGDILPHPLQHKTHPEKQNNYLRGNLKETGKVDVLRAYYSDRNGGKLTFFDGHGRRSLRPGEIWNIAICDLNDAEADCELLVFDAIGGYAQVERDLLDTLLRETSTGEAALQELMSELAAANELYVDPPSAGEPSDAEPQIDRAAELNEKWKVKAGDLFQIGAHRLLCGDSTKAEDVARLMGGEKADIWLTDPPYNVNYTGKTKDALTIENDSMSDDSFREFLKAAFAAAFENLKAGGAFYIWHADSEGYNFRGAVHDVKQKVRQCVVWVKNTLVLGRQDYQWKHEPCLYGWKEGASHTWHSDRTQTTVLQFDKPSRNGEHPTMKPVELFSYLVGNSSKAGDILLDSFGGSGTSMVAAENLQRESRLMEKDPNYCAVILERMATAFPDLKIERVQE